MSGLILPFALGKDFSKLFCITIVIAVFVHYVFSILQITEKDPLTGLLNRQAFYAYDRFSCSERGSVDFQMNEVSDRCNMSKGALYYYFSDREELVQAVFAEVFDETIEALEATCDQAETGREAIRLLCAEIVRRLDAGGPFTLAISNEMAVSRDKALTVASERLGRIVKLVSTQFTRAKSEGIIREDVDARLAATHVVGGFLLASVAALDLGYDDDREGMVSALVQLSLRGLGTEGAVL